MKYLKYIFFILLILFVIAFIALKVFSEKEPVGQAGQQADALATEVMEKLNKQAFDSLPYLQWEFFRPGQKYFWDKQNNRAIIEWGENKVLMNLDSQMAVAYKDGQIVEGEALEKMKTKAWSNWCNDSFWMIAPFKLFDPGTTRELVEVEEENALGLHVKYASGGVTPGDSYLWIIGEDKIPTGYKMFTSIIPLQGMYSSWAGWDNFGGVLLSTKHSIAGKEVEMKGVKAGRSLQEFGYTEDPFKGI